MSNIIGVVLISYDINKSHTEVKNAMKTLGYMETGKYPDGYSYQLPNTTLWHNSKSTTGAIADLKTVCKSLNVTLEKAVAVKATDFEGVNPY